MTEPGAHAGPRVAPGTILLVGGVSASTFGW